MLTFFVVPLMQNVVLHVTEHVVEMVQYVDYISFLLLHYIPIQQSYLFY